MRRAAPREPDVRKRPYCCYCHRYCCCCWRHRCRSAGHPITKMRTIRLYNRQLFTKREKGKMKKRRSKIMRFKTAEECQPTSSLSETKTKKGGKKEEKRSILKEAGVASTVGAHLVIWIVSYLLSNNGMIGLIGIHSSLLVGRLLWPPCAAPAIDSAARWHEAGALFSGK